MVDSIQSNSFVSSVNVANRFGAAPNIQELIMAVQIQRADVLENQIKDQITDMQKRNEWLQTANKALAELRTQRPTNDKDVRTYGTFTAADGGTVDVKTWMDSQGVGIENTGNDNRGMQGEFDAAINNLKSAIDTVNSQSQMDMVRLQGLMDKRNQAFDMLTNSLANFKKGMDSPIANMRG